MSHVFELMAGFPLLAAEGAADGGHGISDPSIPHMLWTWAIFGLVFLVLWKFAWRPLREQLEARENRIRETVEKAHQVKREAEALLDKHREIMERAKADAQAVLAEGRAGAERAKREAAEAGQREARELVERARREIELETKKAIHEIRQEAVDLTLLAASQVIERSLTGEDERRLASEVIEKLDRLPKET